MIRVCLYDVGSKSTCPLLFTRDPHQLIEPDDPLLFAVAGLRVSGRTCLVTVVAVEKWESRLGGISKGRWEWWETAWRFSMASTGPHFPRPARRGFRLLDSGVPSAV